MSQELIAILRELSKLPSVKRKTKEELFKEKNLLECRITGKILNAKDVEFIDTGAITALNIIHPDIREQLPKDFCKIVCVGCKEVVMLVEPGVNNRGFKLEPYRSYHVIDCPKCNPSKYENGVVESRLIEEIYWSNEHKKTIVNFKK